MKELINKFLEDKSPAIIGISGTSNKWGNDLVLEFKNKGYSPIPVGKNATEIHNIKCVQQIEDIPADVKNVIFSVSKQASESIIDSLPDGRFDTIWFTFGSKNKAIVEKAKAKRINVIYGYCPFMFLDGTGIHKFHYTLKKIFG